jgi:hypothetical protein
MSPGHREFVALTHWKKGIPSIGGAMMIGDSTAFYYPTARPPLIRARIAEARGAVQR